MHATYSIESSPKKQLLKRESLYIYFTWKSPINTHGLDRLSRSDILSRIITSCREYTWPHLHNHTSYIKRQVSGLIGVEYTEIDKPRRYIKLW